jgi:hypothetical protein
MKTTLFFGILLFCSLGVKSQVISRQERLIWNGFVDYLTAKNLSGSTELDKPPREKSIHLWKEFCKSRNLNLDYHDFVSHVQRNIAAYRKYAWARVLSGKAVYTGIEADFMPGLSTVDGWAGSRTTSYKFPSDSLVIVLSPTKVVSQPNPIYRELINDTTLLVKNIATTVSKSPF